MNEPTTYEIVLKGRAGARLLRPLLDDFVRNHTDDGFTRLIGEARDTAHLHGVVAYLTSMNLELISISPFVALIAQPRPVQPNPVQPNTDYNEWNPQS